MAETANKTKPKADEPTAEQNAIEELQKQFASLAEENSILRDTVARLQPTESPEAAAERAAREEWAQHIADVIAGGKEGDPVTRKEAREAIKIIREAGIAKLAKRRGLEPEERTTMSEGLKEHIAALGRSAEDYFEREGVGF